MATVSGIKLAAKASGIATLSDARAVLGVASGLLHTAFDIVEHAQTADDLTSIGVEEDLGIADAKYGGLLALLNQADAYAQKIYALVDGQDGPIDPHTQEQVVASLQLSNEAFANVQDAFPGTPELNIDFADTTTQAIKLIGDKVADTLKNLAKAAGAGAAQTLVSFWYVVIPLLLILGWVLWRKVKRVTS